MGTMTRSVKVDRHTPETEADTMHALKRIHLTYYARLSIPQDRQDDVGKSEVVRTLQTRDRNEAIRRRNAKLAEMAAMVDADLRRRGLPPLTGEWSTPWHVEAVKDRQARLMASDDRPYDPDGHSESRREAIEQGILEREQELDATHGPKVGSAYRKIAMASGLPIHDTAERWHRDCQGRLKNQTIMQNRQALRLLVEFMTTNDQALPRDPLEAMTTISMQDVTRKVAGEFGEWLMSAKGNGGKTAACRISSLSSLWRWADRKGLLELDRSPWQGQTTGMKATEKPEETDERPYTDGELLRLMAANPAQGRTNKYARAIREMLRLGLLTGARQNELCSLERRDVIHGGTGIVIRKASAKTASGARPIPLHALVQPIIAARLAEAGPEATAPLFPELLPGGPDGKRSWTFSSRFASFRQAVLGADPTVDFHSLRRCFSTYFTLARAEGVPECSLDVHERLIGHKPATLSGSTYTAKDLGWSLYVRAVNGMVEKGISEEVRGAVAA